MWYIFKFIDMRIFENLLGYFWKFYFIKLLGNVGIVEIIDKFWNGGIHQHHGCMKKGLKLWKVYEMEKKMKQ